MRARARPSVPLEMARFRLFLACFWLVFALYGPLSPAVEVAAAGGWPGPQECRRPGQLAGMGAGSQGHRADTHRAAGSAGADSSQPPTGSSDLHRLNALDSVGGRSQGGPPLASTAPYRPPIGPLYPY